MRPTVFVKAVVNLLGLNFQCQVEETPNSFNCTDCLVTGLQGSELSVPIGLFITQEHASKPVFPLWLYRMKGSFKPACAIVFVSLANSLNERLSASAIYRMLLRHARTLKEQEFKVLYVSKEGRGDFIKPEMFLAQLDVERFMRTHSRRNGHVTRGEQGQPQIKSGGSSYEVSFFPFEKRYLRSIGRLRVGDKVTFRPISANGTNVAEEVRRSKPLPKITRRRACA